LGADLKKNKKNMEGSLFLRRFRVKKQLFYGIQPKRRGYVEK
jgi:hypothetical protein